ncbi:hypothetical protein KOW79_019484 [Hemibagrus wyckioides]|uniref:Uncharacterized protein n=1 Tax=Hemibagrus wyckioides TaxID=337641 RepID=A0A9D3N5U1_9TELE|nr:hypothetical protein KOW79_019484 [Hemibagrus wyckioides]
MCPRPLGVSPKPREQSAAYSPGLVPSADMTPGSLSRRYVLEQGARQQQRGQPLTSAAHPAHRNGENSWSQADTDVDRQSGICRQSHHNPASEIYTDLLKLDTELPRGSWTSLKRLLGLGSLQDLDLD